MIDHNIEKEYQYFFDRIDFIEAIEQKCSCWKFNAKLKQKFWNSILGIQKYV